MSSTKLDGSDSTISSKETHSTSMSDDIAQLASLLSQDSLDDTGEANVAELLQRLDNADGMAKGVESRLIDILGNLDNLLATLESQKGPADSVNSSQGTEEPVQEGHQ